MAEITLGLLAVAAALFLARLVLGPSLADRVIALDGLVLIVVASLVVESARTEEGFFVDAAIVIGLLGFVGTGVAARFIERRGG